MPDYIDVSARIVDPSDEYRLFDLTADPQAALAIIADLGPRQGGGRCVLAPPTYYQLASGVEDLRCVNDFVLAQRKPGGAVCAAFGVAEPKYQDAAIAELARIAALGARGVVWSARAQGVFADDALMADLCHRAHDLGLVSMLRATPYSANEALTRIWGLARRCPDMPLIVSGALMSYDYAQAILSGQGGDNLLYDTAGWGLASALPHVVSALGAGRVLFGTGGGSPPDEAAAGLRKALQGAGLPGGAVDDILWRNAVRVLGLDVTEPAQ